MKQNKESSSFITQAEQFGAANYQPLPVVISKAEGVWVEDPEGNRYMDMLSAYSALNQGHRHPDIIRALKDQADNVTLTSRAFHNEEAGRFYEKVSQMTNKEKVLPQNTGTEAVETAIKAMRRWGYENKDVKEGQAEIIACEGNFHGRTMASVSLSSEEEYKRGFGPMLPGIKLVPYGDIDALKEAVTPNTVGFIMEPIQGEAGINLPPEGYVKEAAEVCRQHNVVFAADEIQTGLGRTGHTFACDWEAVEPDIYILGKALGGGVFPVSCIAANDNILHVFQPGSHGSTFGGNPLAAAVAVAALDVLDQENLAERSRRLGRYFKEQLKKLEHPAVKEVRGKGLFIGIELTEPARPYCEKLKEKGLLCKETHDTVIRLAPPLIISEDELNQALDIIFECLSLPEF